MSEQKKLLGPEPTEEMLRIPRQEMSNYADSDSARAAYKSMRQAAPAVEAELCSRCAELESAVRHESDCVDAAEERIVELEATIAQQAEEIARLTVERDEARRTVRMAHEAGTQQAEQLQALAAQNKVMWDALITFGKHDRNCETVTESGCPGCSCGLHEALATPDLSSPILAKVRAEALRDFATRIRNTGRDEIFVDRIEEEADAIEREQAEKGG